MGALTAAQGQPRLEGSASLSPPPPQGGMTVVEQITRPVLLFPDQSCLQYLHWLETFKGRRRPTRLQPLPPHQAPAAAAQISSAGFQTRNPNPAESWAPLGGRRSPGRASSVPPMPSGWGTQLRNARNQGTWSASHICPRLSVCFPLSPGDCVPHCR